MIASGTVATGIGVIGHSLCAGLYLSASSFDRLAYLTNEAVINIAPETMQIAFNTLFGD